METVIRILAIIFFSIISSASFSQGIDGYYKVEEQQFKEGIYPNVELVKKNSPIPPEWIETEMDINDRNFYKKLTRGERIIFFDDNGVRTLLITDDLWGYGQNGNLYINVGGAFHKFLFVGRYSYFIAAKTTYVPSIYVRRADIEYMKPAVLTLNKQEYIVDIVEDKVWELDEDGLERILKNDPELWNEFMNLEKRKKEKSKIPFLRRYNEKHPLELPVN